MTASALASAVGLQPTAANNRLVNIERKGFVLRVKRGRDEGDLFVDPRVPYMTPFTASRPSEPVAMRHTLQQAGITSDPYAPPPREVDGEPAERLAAILRRHHKLRKPTPARVGGAMLTWSFATDDYSGEFSQFICCIDGSAPPWVREADIYVRGWA